MVASVRSMVGKLLTYAEFTAEPPLPGQLELALNYPGGAGDVRAVLGAVAVAADARPGGCRWQQPVLGGWC